MVSRVASWKCAIAQSSEAEKLRGSGLQAFIKAMISSFLNSLLYAVLRGGEVGSE